MNLAALLLSIAATVALGPEVIEALGYSYAAALYYVAYGTETAILWLVVYHLSLRVEALRPYWSATGVVTVWAVMETALRPLCRLMLPMDRAPSAAVGLCTQAGMPTAHLTPFAAVLAAAAVARYFDTNPTKVRR